MMPNQDTTRTRPSLRLEPLATPVDRKEDDATGINVRTARLLIRVCLVCRLLSQEGSRVMRTTDHSLENISRRGPRNCRSLHGKPGQVGFAPTARRGRRDDKG